MKADQLSKTAAFLAIKFYGLTREERYQSLFDDSIVSFYSQLVKALPAPLCYYHFWLKYRWIRRFYIWSEELFLPGDLLHVIARKWYIKRIIDQLQDEEYEQIIVLGAGFDHLAFCYAQQGMACFEVDTPRMTQFKHRFFEDAYPGQKHPEIISVLLPNNNLATVFKKRAELDPDKKTVIVAEGFFDYLDTKVVSESLRQIREYFSYKPTLISTHFALDELSKFHRQVFRSSVWLVDEQLAFNTSVTEFRKLLSDAGFSINRQYNSEIINNELHSRLQTNHSVLEGFYILEAQ